MIKKTTDPWASPKGIKTIMAFIKELSTLAANPHPIYENYVKCVHLDMRRRTITASDMKTGVIISLPEGPETTQFMLSMVAAHVLPTEASTASTLLTGLGHLDLRFDGTYVSDRKYPQVGMFLVPSAGAKAVPWHGFLDVPPERLVPVMKFVQRHATGNDPWLMYDDTQSPGAKPMFRAFDMWLDPNYKADAVAFAIPDPVRATPERLGQLAEQLSSVVKLST